MWKKLLIEFLCKGLDFAKLCSRWKCQQRVSSFFVRKSFAQIIRCLNRSSQIFRRTFLNLWFRKVLLLFWFNCSENPVLKYLRVFQLYCTVRNVNYCHKNCLEYLFLWVPVRKFWLYQVILFYFWKKWFVFLKYWTRPADARIHFFCWNGFIPNILFKLYFLFNFFHKKTRIFPIFIRSIRTRFFIFYIGKI